MRLFPFVVLCLVSACGGKVIEGAASDAGGDSSLTDTRIDTAPPPFDSVPIIDDGPLPPDDPPPPTSSRTTGMACMTDDECDKTADGLSHCTANLFVVGPLNPTPVCLQFDGSGTDVCIPTEPTAPRFCDGDTGLCTKSGTNPAICWPVCVLRADGAWVDKCSGKNGCNLETVSAADGNMYGTCLGGCRSDGECPAGSKCDPLLRDCVRQCTADADCKKGWPGAPATWKCDTARGACAFAYPKKVGDTCTTDDECVCLKGASGSGRCTSSCRPGDACGAGFTCDALLPADKFKVVSQPPELVGHCLRNCTKDADCGADQVCAASAGLAQKTCRPKS